MIRGAGANNCRAFDSLAPASSLFGIYVHVARRPAGSIPRNANFFNVRGDALQSIYTVPALRIESDVNQTTYAAAAAAWRPWANSSTIFLLNAGMSPRFRLELGFLN